MPDLVSRIDDIAMAMLDLSDQTKQLQNFKYVVQDPVQTRSLHCSSNLAAGLMHVFCAKASIAANWRGKLSKL